MYVEEEVEFPASNLRESNRCQTPKYHNQTSEIFRSRSGIPHSSSNASQANGQGQFALGMS